MLSKFLQPAYRNTTKQLLVRKLPPRFILGRHMDFIPATQYDTPYPKKFAFPYNIKTYYEITPLLFCTWVGMVFIVLSTIWAVQTKVDVVYSVNSRRYLCRTMDLRNPPILKLVLINQRYDPWPEMQDVLDKMKAAEKRALVRVQSCSLV
ncbi:unnamed protein product [Arctia plantaginis]|uniref:Uncharacterized protein n=1 Tax=Arctia plantaginis TaxID=874455 RepID=A0A8S1AYC1_ARCPL|nr:unnamed protein product [Arctia plantaginis]CAB3252079.1 unnamed protein product [Arctia plantaginis]